MSPPPRLPPVAAPMLAALAAMASLPAQAEFYFQPFGGVYVERYYEPLPPRGYYPPPPPVYRAPGRFPFADLDPMLRSMGMTAIGRPRVDGDTYLVDATDRSGMRVRVRVDAFNGRVIAMHPLGQAPVARQAPPRLPAIAPLPPARPPGIANVTAPAPSEPGAPGTPAVAPASVGPAETAPAEVAPAEVVPGGAAIRVIPGVAVPPGTAPAGEARPPAAGTPDGETPAVQAGASSPTGEPEPQPDVPPSAAAPPVGSGTGTGMGTASDTPAGTASVIVGGTGSQPAPATQ